MAYRIVFSMINGRQFCLSEFSPSEKENFRNESSARKWMGVILDRYRYVRADDGSTANDQHVVSSRVEEI